MEFAQFQAMLTKMEGENKKLYGIQFSGTAGYIIFKEDYEFDLATMYDSATDSFIFRHTNIDDKEYIVTKPVGTIYSLVFIDKDDNYWMFDPGWIFG